MSPDQSEGVIGARGEGGRLSKGMGRAEICEANDRADKRLGAEKRRSTKPTEIVLPPGNNSP